MVEVRADQTGPVGPKRRWIVALAALAEARKLYDEYLKTYADELGAKQARTGRDQLVKQIRHQKVRDQAIARAGRPADGSNLRACTDGRCQVRVKAGDVISLRIAGGPYEVHISSVAGGQVVTQLGGFIRSMSSTGGSMVSGDGYGYWSSAPPGELLLNDKFGYGVDRVDGSRATLSVWLAE